MDFGFLGPGLLGWAPSVWALWGLGGMALRPGGGALMDMDKG